ncbi:MAG: GAF domain-containing sensor histidine kinase [Anaerolineae bacterium]|nr:GAF domain-containing sensor histidine kinase [Anaerolineae bacterium]
MAELSLTPNLPQREPPSNLIDELFSLASSRDLDTLLRQALSMAVRLLSAEAGSIMVQIQAPHNFRLGAFRPEAINRIERWEAVIRERLINTSWKIPAGDTLPISTLNLSENRLILVNVPLLKNTSVVGSLSLVLPPTLSLDDRWRQQLGQIARGVGQMASLVVDFQQSQRRLSQMGVFYQVGQALVTTFDINRLLSDTMQLSANIIDAAASSIMLIDEENQELVFEVSHGATSQVLRQQRIPLDEGVAGWVARHGHPVIANQARTDPRFSHRVDVRTGFLTQSIAAVPLKIKGRIIGVLEVLNKYSGSGFDHEDIRLMSSIAAQAAIAIENARLYQQVRQERDYIINAEENVRRELARNLHDGPVQMLSAISMSLDHLERLNQVQPEAVQNEIEALRNLVHKATRDARNVLFELRPIVLETQGLVPALGQYVTQLRSTEKFKIHFEPIEAIELDTRVTGTIFSIVQEAVNNIKRHADARNVWITLTVNNDKFTVTVKDDGVGFDVKQVEDTYDQKGSLGLLNMRERAGLIEADLYIISKTESANRGTIVRLILPLPAEEKAKHSEDTETSEG